MARTTISTSYLSTIFYPETFPKTIEASLEVARRLKEERGFDTIAFSGMSGAAMAFILANEMKLPLLCVRKKGESSHYVNGYEDRILEGNLTTEKFLLVDDFISSGKTVNYMLDCIKKDIPTAVCVGMLMYAGYGGTYKHKRYNPDDSSKWTEWDVYQPRSEKEY